MSSRQRTKDPDAPKKPLSGYILWSTAERRAGTFADLSFTEQAKALGEAWKALGDAAKAPWAAEAARDKQR